jgi:hypothetical protein
VWQQLLVSIVVAWELGVASKKMKILGNIVDENCNIDL